MERRTKTVLEFPHFQTFQRSSWEFVIQKGAEQVVAKRIRCSAGDEIEVWSRGELVAQSFKQASRIMTVVIGETDDVSAGKT